MKLLFDLQALQNGSRSRGIGRYVLSLLRALALQPGIEVWALLNAALDEHLDEARGIAAHVLGHDRILIFHGLKPTSEIDEDNWHRRKLAECAYEQFVGSFDFDALLVGSLFEGFQDETVVSLQDPAAQYRKYVVLYDLIPLLNAEQFLGWNRIHDWYHDRLGHLACADGLLAISESARSEAIEHLGRRADEVVAIGTATDGEIFSSASVGTTGVLNRLGISRPYVMHASAFEERKNFAGLLRAFASLPPTLRSEHQLVFAGNAKPEPRAELEQLRDQLGLKPDDLIFTGFVDDAELAELYRRCTLFVFPSFHEGFGLPALEAMSCGCPAIGSNRSSIPEVIGREDLLFDPADEKQMSFLMAGLLGDKEALRGAAEHAVMQAATFSWDRTAQRAVAAMNGQSSGLLPNYRPMPTVAQALMQRFGSAEPSSSDLEQLAEALVANEEEELGYYSRQATRSGLSWRIEGPFDSSYSLALLNRETARALEDLGCQVALHSTEGPGDFPPDPEFLKNNPDIAVMHERTATLAAHDADVASRLLYPPRVHDMAGRARALHHYAWEESGFPQEWVEEFNSSLTFMTCLSAHVEKLMVDNGVTVPLLTSGCGVDHWERVGSDREFTVQGRTFRFLHVSSCFPRKGADLLLAAYGAAFSSDDDVSLIIKTFENPHNDIAEQLETLRLANPKFPHVHLIFADLSEGQLKALYQRCDVMVGPSCAEGYGLPFAEAMLSGLPVITTAWGGHLDFCNEGNSWLVDFKFERARTHFGLWSSAWARADVGALAATMQRAKETSAADRAAMAKRGREQLLHRHKWSDVARRLIAASAILPSRRTGETKIGWMTTWGSRCGVATYSAHLTSHLGLSAKIFAPSNEDHLSDGPEVNRCWTLGKEGASYQDIFENCLDDGFQILVIQFNYNFYDHAELTKLVDKCVGAGIGVIMFLHSTIDPPVPDKKSYHLGHLRAALGKCDRVLVHSIADLNRLKSLGLVDNVTLFPHGILKTPTRRAKQSNGMETIASYGFALPQKGLEQLVEAVSLLHKRGRPVRLRLINAEYPVDVSREVIDGLRRRAAQFDIADFVEHHHEFLPDEDSLRLLQDSDLAVFPYQQTGESASGAVRYGMAARIPVAVTPLPIFDDLDGAAFRLEGTSADLLADGIEAVLNSLKQSTPAALSTLEAADRWRSQHYYTSVGKRLANVCIALAHGRSPVASNEAPRARKQDEDAAKVDKLTIG